MFSPKRSQYLVSSDFTNSRDTWPAETPEQEMMRRTSALLLALALALLGVAQGHVNREDAYTAEELEEAKLEFGSMDKDKDGFLTREELLDPDENDPEHRHAPEEDQIDEFFGTYDANGDDKVSFEEIQAKDAALRAAA